MAVTGTEHLRILVANERQDRLERLGAVVRKLGHDVVAGGATVPEVTETAARECPDVALVGLAGSSEHALDLIAQIARKAGCPVIALLPAAEPAYVREAARRGVFAYIVEATPEQLQSAIEITLQRFVQYRDLELAMGRRATIEQAKGILMAHHGIDADAAFSRLREHSQHHGQKLAEVAAAVVMSHLLLAPNRDVSAGDGNS